MALRTSHLAALCVTEFIKLFLAQWAAYPKPRYFFLRKACREITSKYHLRRGIILGVVHRIVIYPYLR